MRKDRFCHNLGDIVFDGVGPFDIPQIAPERWTPDVEFIGFNYATGESKENRRTKGVHFFVDDEHFERVWRQWRRYGELLSDYAAVMTPDFSMFTDWPVAVQIYNHYRKHFVGAYLQMLGVKSIRRSAGATKRAMIGALTGNRWAAAWL